MFSHSSACKRLLLYCHAVAFPVLLFAQNPMAEDQEYSIIGALPGEQTFPQLSLTSDGGYIVWQDNSIDGQGLGIGAQRLDGGGSAIGGSIRVNQQASGDQARPVVAILNNGNAIFAWQSGQVGFPNVRARVLGADGNFLTGDLALGGSTRVIKRQNTRYVSFWQNNRVVNRPLTFVKTIRKSRLNDQGPAIASLADGSAVVVYFGIRRDITTETKLIRQVSYPGGRRYINDTLQRVRTRADWMREVYFQRLSATGQKLGAEVLVNQANTFNQRNSAVAPLPDGNFVVVWVSEEQFASAFRGTNYIVVKGRLYNGAGEPLGNEFRIDGSGPVLCGHPAVAASADGGFLVAWSQLDRARTNSWDIYGRTFSASGAATGSPLRINTYTYGDQVAPRIATGGANHLLVWTSLAQDGSWEGVYGQRLTGGALSGDEFRVNTTTRSRQRNPSVSSSGNDLFLVAWENFTGLTSSFDLMGQKYLVAQPPPAPAPPLVAALSQDSLLLSWPDVTESSLLNYELYMDGSATPFTVMTNNWLASGLQAASTHSFRLAYLLADARRSLLSPPASGTTLGSDGTTKTGSSISAAAPSNGPTLSTLDSSNAPRIRLALSDKGMSLRWNTEAGAVYQVQMSTNLSSWSNLGSARSAVGTSDFINIDNAGGGRFYRVLRVR